MIVDDLPEPQYNTFHDPGAAAMLSITFANAIALISSRRLNLLTGVVFCFGLILKGFIQPFFWVHNAWIWDTGTLLLTHVFLSFMVSFKGPLTLKLEACAATLVAITFSLFGTFALNGLLGSSWLASWLELAAARILIPWAFWTAVFVVEQRSPGLHLTIDSAKTAP